MDEHLEQDRQCKDSDKISSQRPSRNTVCPRRPDMGNSGAHESTEASTQEYQSHQHRTAIKESWFHCHGEESFQSMTAVGTTRTGRCWWWERLIAIDPPTNS